MSPIRLLALAILIPFSILSVYAVMKVGYWGIFTYHFPNPAGWQVLTDLIIAVTLIILWMIKDARENGRNAVPYIIASIFLGSIGPLLYLVMAPKTQRHSTHATS